MRQIRASHPHAIVIDADIVKMRMRLDFAFPSLAKRRSWLHDESGREFLILYFSDADEAEEVRRFARGRWHTQN